MPLPNRVTPFGDLEAHAARGLFLGIRGGRFHDPATQTVPGRPWASRRWICCDLEFKGRAAAFRAAGRKVWDGRRYTELFFCDEVTALAAGHRPCAECRRPAYLAFREALVRAGAFDAPPSADAMDLRLDAERRDGRAKRLHAAILDDLPDGAMIARDGQAWAVRGPRLLRWSHGGYVEAVARRGGEVQALTPPLSLAALRGGYAPAWHGSAQADP